MRAWMVGLMLFASCTARIPARPPMDLAQEWQSYGLARERFISAWRQFLDACNDYGAAEDKLAALHLENIRTVNAANLEAITTELARAKTRLRSASSRLLLATKALNDRARELSPKEY